MLSAAADHGGQALWGDGAGPGEFDTMFAALADDAVADNDDVMALHAADRAQTARRMSAVLQPGALQSRVGASAGRDGHPSSATLGKPSYERTWGNPSKPSGLPLLALPPSPSNDVPNEPQQAVPALWLSLMSSRGTPRRGDSATPPLASARSPMRRQLSGGLLNFRFSPGSNTPRTASPRSQPPRAPNSARTQSSA